MWHARMNSAHYVFLNPSLTTINLQNISLDLEIINIILKNIPIQSYSYFRDVGESTKRIVCQFFTKPSNSEQSRREDVICSRDKTGHGPELL